MQLENCPQTRIALCPKKLSFGTRSAWFDTPTILSFPLLQYILAITCGTKATYLTQKASCLYCLRRCIKLQRQQQVHLLLTTTRSLPPLAQCTPDLSPNDCRTCLNSAVESLPLCCDGKVGGRVLFPSCKLRYELYPFYRSIDQWRSQPKIFGVAAARHQRKN